MTPDGQIANPLDKAANREPFYGGPGRTLCNYIFVVIYNPMTAPRFTWDEDKNLSNRRKHGVSFELAVRVFLDPLHLSVQDRVEDGEQRWQTLGLIGGVAVVLVAHTFTEDGPTDKPVEVIRIISARPATRRERTRYEEG
jgi:hypothetical protein